MTDLIETPETPGLAERLRTESELFRVTDTNAGLHTVRRIVRRRRRRSTAIGVAAAAGLVVAGAVVLAPGFRNGPDRITSDDTTVPTTMSIDTSSSSVVASAPSPDSTAPPVDASRATPTAAAAVVVAEAAGDIVDVTAQVATVGKASFPDWMVPWDGGFLAGIRNSSTDTASAAFSAAFSPDGRTWRAVPFGPQGGQLQNVQVVTTDGRLAVFGTQRGSAGNEIAVVSVTTDLDSWRVAPIPILPPSDLPALVTSSLMPVTIAIDAEGWVAVVESSLQLDVVGLAATRVDGEIGAVGFQWSDDGIRLTVDSDAGAQQVVDVAWNELEAEIGIDMVDAVRRRTSPELWTGTWDEEDVPVRVDVPTEIDEWSWIDSVVPVRDGFVVVRATSELRSGDVPIEVRELVARVGESRWFVLKMPTTISGRVLSAFPLDGDLGVVVEDDQEMISVARVAVQDQTWTPLLIPGLPEAARYVPSSPTSAMILDVAPRDRFETAASPTVVDQGGYRLTMTLDFPTSSYEVTSLVTSEVVVSETIDLTSVEGSFELAFEYLTGGIDDTIVVDPSTGEVLMDISADEMVAARPEEQEGVDWFESAPWILATVDGSAWYSAAPPPPSSGSELFTQSRIAVSGGRLLSMTAGGQWFVVDLEPTDSD